jgi:hypothetical protein
MDDVPSEKIDRQIRNAGLPTGGQMPFIPQLVKNKSGDVIIKKAPVLHGPKKGKHGYLDTMGRVWVRDRAHANYPDHWDVQENGGTIGYTRVDSHGNLLV